VWLTSVPSLVSASGVTNEEQLLLENKVNSIQGKVFINDETPGGTTKAYQNITTYPDGSMGILQKNLTTGEISFQGINSSGQRVFETSLTPHEANTLIGANSSSKMLVGNGAVSQSVISRVSYQTRNNSLVLYDKTPVPVATNGALVPPLTTNRALATVPLLTTGVNKIIRKTDFYVGLDGSSSTLLATAYRYLDSKAYVETKKNMIGNLSYFGFKKFDTTYQARDAFQIKYDYYNQNDPELSWSDAAVRGTFDTLQLYDNATGKLKVRIPYTFGDTGKDLEPFTESYSEYGQGGELQMIHLRWDEDLIIKYDRLDILLNPRTDLILKEEITK